MKLPLTYPARYHALKTLKGSDGKVLWDSAKKGTYRRKEHGPLC